MRKTLKMACAAAAVVASLALLGRTMTAQSLTYTKGQNIAPAYEGWEQDADGSKWFVFGYMNRNWVEEIDVAPGAGQHDHAGRTRHGTADALPAAAQSLRLSCGRAEERSPRRTR